MSDIIISIAFLILLFFTWKIGYARGYKAGRVDGVVEYLDVQDQVEGGEYCQIPPVDYPITPNGRKMRDV